MFRSQLLRSALLTAGILLLALSAAAQNSANGKAVLWEAVDVSEQNLLLGPGGSAMQPDLSRITLIKEEKGGYSKKYRIKDGSGRVWVAKLGKEAQPETAAVRLLAAIGYKTEVNYLVPRITIPGKGTFSNVRLEARPEDVKRGKEWKWGSTPFERSNEMQGLKIMMAFLNNWDMKSANNVIFETDGERQYVISDLGVAFGKTGSNSWPLIWRIGRSRNNPGDYAKARFVTGSDNKRVKFRFNGKNRSRMNDITLANARWLADLLTQLSDRQIRDAFRAANYSQANINLLTRAVKDRIAQLDRAADGQRLAGTR